MGKTTKRLDCVRRSYDDSPCAGMTLAMVFFGTVAIAFTAAIYGVKYLIHKLLL